MAYDPLNLPDNAIPEGTDISHIEEGVTELNNSLAEKTDEVYATSIDDLCTKILSTSAYTCTNIYLSADCVNEITSGAYSGYAGYGIVGRAGAQSTIIDFFFIINSGRIFISGRISDGAVTRTYIKDNGT